MNYTLTARVYLILVVACLQLHIAFKSLSLTIYEFVLWIYAGRSPSSQT
jgi:hypothetical protein